MLLVLTLARVMHASEGKKKPALGIEQILQFVLEFQQQMKSAMVCQLLLLMTALASELE